ncbi:MAG: CopG family antitoxin [Peptococcaceae bacterium]
MAKIPKFDSEEEEARYWESHSVTDHLDELVLVEEEIEITVPTRKRRPITIRIDEDALNAVRIIAEDMRIPYQTLIRSWLVEKLKRDYPEKLKERRR